MEQIAPETHRILARAPVDAIVPRPAFATTAPSKSTNGQEHPAMLIELKSSAGAHPRDKGTAMRDLIAASFGQIYRAASVVAPHNLWLIKHRSKWLRSRGDAGTALALLDRALISAPLNDRLIRERVRVIGELADRRWAAGDAEGASALVDQVLAVVSQDERVIRERADTCARFAMRRRAEGDAAGALELIDQALACAPRNERLMRERAYAIVQLANLRRQQGDGMGALTLIDEALVQIPEHPGLLVARASTLRTLLVARGSTSHTLRRYHEALDAWQCLIAQAPLDARGWAGAARALYMTDRPEQIEALIEAYLRVLGDQPARHVRAAHVALAGRRVATFEALLERARIDAHRSAIRLRELAELFVRAGSIGEALNCLDEAIELDRQDEAARARREHTLRTLRLTGVDGESLPPPQRTGLRMPDLALLALLRRAPIIARQTSGKIVMVYTTLGPGGAERQLANTVRGIGAVESRPEVVLMPARDENPELDRFHVGTLASLQVPIEPCDRGSIDMTVLRAALGADVEDLLALLPLTMRQQIGVLTSRFLHDLPAVVHAWSDHRNITAGIAAALAGVPRIVLSTRSVAPLGTRTVPTYFREIYRALLDRPGVVLANNSAAGARTYAEWLGVEAKRVRVIYNGVDIDGLERARDPQTTAAHRARLGLPADAWVVGSVFRLGWVKRPLLWLETAAEVARRCSEVHFVIVGEGPLRDSMAAAAAELGIADRLHMPGLSRDVAPWYDLMDVVLLTSEREGTSNTALEAQALGKPVVSPAVGGMPETFVPDKSGFLVPADPSPVEIAACVTRALMDTAWRTQAEQVARSFIRRRFSIQRMVDDTLHLYALKSAGVSNRHDAGAGAELLAPSRPGKAPA